MFRGAAVGSTALLAAACFAVIPVAALYRHFSERRSQVGGSRESSISSALARLRLPGRVFVVYSVLLQPTATACAGLLMLALSGGDIVLAVIVALLWFGVLLWFVWAVQCGCSRLVTARIIEPSVGGGGVLDFVVERRNDWVPQSHLHADDVSLCTEPKWLLHPSHEGAEHFTHQFSVLISSVGGGPWREQYYCFGCLWSVATGVVGALDPGVPSSCVAAQITLVVVAALSLLSLVAIRPYPSKFDQGLQIALEVLSLITAILLLTNAGQDGVQSISYVSDIGLAGTV